ncbi:MAG: zf-HC2 domain-containing protein [Pseudonocardia sp.]|nr:zf-HC2 domain-containing protein [Pseudonocardia sp.]
MACRRVQEAISARIDGEDPGLTAAQVDAHLASCPACRAFAMSAATVHRKVRVQPAETVPDLADAILRVATPPTPAPVPAAPEWPRYVLLVVALTQLLIAVPALILGDQAGATVHLAHELGSWDAALAAAWLVVCWSPRRASGFLPFTLALTAVMLGTGLLDVVSGRTPLPSESHHILDILGLAMVWVLARSTPSTRSLLRFATGRQPHPA